MMALLGTLVGRGVLTAPGRAGASAPYLESFLGIILVLVVLGSMMVLIRHLQRRFSWHAELSRKAVHVTMGLVCLSFPWLFAETWPVWLLGIGAVAALGSVRLVPALRSRLGTVLNGVDRHSWGELLFPVAVAFVFWLAHGRPLLFWVPVLNLALADAVAALIGQRYGFGTYETDDGWKTVEGSTAFFLTAFLSTHVPVLLGSDTGRLECLLIAAVMGLILMLMEAISWCGLDNLFLPLVSYVCLVRMLEATASELLTRLVVLLLLVVGVWYWHKGTRLTQSATIAAALAFYVAWAVGGWHWLVAPLVVAAVYALPDPKAITAPQRHTVYAIFSIGGVGLCWLCLSQVLHAISTVYAYGVGYGAHLGMLALAYFSDAKRSEPLPLAAAKALAVGYMSLAVPYVLIWHENPNVWRLAAGAFVIVLGAIVAFARWQPKLRDCPTDAARWIREGLVAALASAIAFLFVSFIEPW